MKSLAKNSLFALLFIFSTVSALAAPSMRCSDLFSNLYVLSKYSDKAYQMMMEGSANVSRTKAKGMNFFDTGKDTSNVSQTAEINFGKAVRFVLDNHHNLPINLTTARKLNFMLTENLVPDSVRGRFDYRPDGAYPEKVDAFIPRGPRGFYIDWLESKEAKRLYQEDPVALADIVHNSVAALDGFPDGNGRLSRLMADLVLIKRGLAPAYYTSMEDYFARGNFYSGVTREATISYYREIAWRGYQTLFQIQ